MRPTLLWSVANGPFRRLAVLDGGGMGFEIRLLDERGAILFTQECATELACREIAADHRAWYLERQWLPVRHG
jgi:hypothetical protein